MISFNSIMVDKDAFLIYFTTVGRVLGSLKVST